MGLFVPNGAGQQHIIDHRSAELTFAESTDIHSAEHLTVTQAGELLDWLEGHGIQAYEVEIDSDGLFSVRWGA